MKVKVIIKRTDERIGHVTNISTTEKNLRTQIGGDYEEYEFAPTLELPGIVVLSRADVKPWEPINCKIKEHMKMKPVQIAKIFRGNVIVIGKKVEDNSDRAYEDVPLTLDEWKRLIAGEASY